MEQGVIGDWAADGSKRTLPCPIAPPTNGSGTDGTYRRHNAAAFPANDAAHRPPRAVPRRGTTNTRRAWGAGGGRLNAAARAAGWAPTSSAWEARLAAAATRDPRACAASWAGIPARTKALRLPSYPFDAQALTDWAMDEYHYAADPKLIYKIASEGGKKAWTGLCPTAAMRWRLGEVPVARGAEERRSTIVLKMKDATDAMFAFGQRNGVCYKFSARQRWCATIQGASWAWWRARILAAVYITLRAPSS